MHKYAPNKFIKVSVIFIAVISLILLIGNKDWFPNFYNPIFMGIMGIASVFIILSPRLVLNPVGDDHKKKSIDFVQDALSLILVLSSAGGIGLYQLYRYGFQYDKFLHFFVSFILVITICNFLFYWHKIHIAKTFVYIAIGVVAAGFFWELFEYLTDLCLGTQTFGFYGELVFRDTVWDMIMNAFGAIIGAIVVLYKNPIK